MEKSEKIIVCILNKIENNYGHLQEHFETFSKEMIWKFFQNIVNSKMFEFWDYVMLINKSVNLATNLQQNMTFILMCT